MKATPSTCSRSGFSLIEALVCLSLVSVVLGLFAGIMHNITRQNSAIQERDQLLAGAVAGLDRLIRDCRSSIAWTTPNVSDGGLQSSLEFDIPDFDQDSIRLPLPPLEDPLPTWDPLAFRVRLRYRVDQDCLLREVKVGGVFQGLSLCSNTTGLSVQRRDKESMTVVLSLLVDGKVQSIQQTLRLPNPQSWRNF